MAAITAPVVLDSTMVTQNTKLDSIITKLGDIASAAGSGGARISYGTTALVDGSSTLATGELYFQYEG